MAVNPKSLKAKVIEKWLKARGALENSIRRAGRKVEDIGLQYERQRILREATPYLRRQFETEAYIQELTRNRPSFLKSLFNKQLRAQRNQNIATVLELERQRALQQSLLNALANQYVSVAERPNAIVRAGQFMEQHPYRSLGIGAATLGLGGLGAAYALQRSKTGEFYKEASEFNPRELEVMNEILARFNTSATSALGKSLGEALRSHIEAVQTGKRLKQVQEGYQKANFLRRMGYRLRGMSPRQLERKMEKIKSRRNQNLLEALGYAIPTGGEMAQAYDLARAYEAAARRRNLMGMALSGLGGAAVGAGGVAYMHSRNQ